MRRKELQERGNERGTMLILRWGKKIDITEDWKKSDDRRCGDMHGRGHLDFLQNLDFLQRACCLHASGECD